MIRGAELHNYIPGVGIGAVGCFLCGDAPVSLSQLIQVWSKGELLYDSDILLWHPPLHVVLFWAAFSLFFFKLTQWVYGKYHVIWLALSTAGIKLLSSISKSEFRNLKKAQERRAGCLFYVLWQYCLSSLSTCGEAVMIPLQLTIGDKQLWAPKSVHQWMQMSVSYLKQEGFGREA